MKGRTCWRLASVLATVLAFMVAPTVTPRARAAASVQSEGEQVARRSFQRGENHFRAGRFADALTEYQAGYAASPLPGFLINMAQCQRRLGDLKTARTTYQKFVMVAPDSPLVPEVKSLVEELDRLMLAEDESASRSPATLARAEDQAPAPIPVAPAPFSTPVLLPATSDGGAVAAKTDPAIERTPSRTRWWLWGTIAAAVAGGTVAVFAMRSPGMETLDAGTLGTLRR